MASIVTGSAIISTGGAANLGTPIMLTGLQLDGVAGSSAREGEALRLITRFFMTSDEPWFHRIVAQIAGHLTLRAREAGHAINLERADTVLLVIKPDNTAELWIDAAAMAMNVIPRRTLEAGSVVFSNDVLDVLSMNFPLVTIAPEDRVVCFFRVGWRFAFFADFNHARAILIENMERDLGTLYRRLRYAELYDTMGSPQTVSALTMEGWFPFAEILDREFKQLVSHAEAGFELSELEANIINAFDAARLERMFAQWMTKPHFSGKEELLRSALRSFNDRNAVAVIKTGLTEIEGILNHAYKKQHGHGAKIKKLLTFAIDLGTHRSGASDTLLLTEAFGKYLTGYVFADFDPSTESGKSGSRHAVGHGAASPESYTMARALQVLLTLDQLAIYT